LIKAGEYVRGTNARIGFVATNSITQGDQVAQLWPVLFGRCGLEIAFAHRTFAWGSDARGKANVHVVILGLDRREAVPPERRLFSYPDIASDPEESRHAALSPYLFDAGRLADPHIVVQNERKPINNTKRLQFGTQPLEDGNLTFSREEKQVFLESEPSAAPHFRPFLGAEEFINGEERWILHSADIPVNELHNLPILKKRLQAVREFRSRSKRQITNRLADYPTSYGVTVIPDREFLIIPRVSSERREYAPIGWVSPPAIPSEATMALQDATLADFALLTSAMHMAWLRNIGGRLESRYRYSIGVVYNTFPLPRGGGRFVEIGAARASRAGRSRHSSGRDARRPLRPGLDAAEPSPGASSARSRGGPALPARRVCVRTGEGGTSFRAV
ncbi:MAG: hypothetical protein OXH14_13670, partial [Alphaproteobacteria bacterium]|nr:hypothetical protein [Alphaproteobacteria bacterium]